LTREKRDALLLKVKSFPDEPGVYLFKDEKKKIIYIGKAKSLKKRINSYFANNPEDRKVEKIKELALDVEFITTNSETEALILENNLIKIHQPMLNARLKDDKTYPFLKITTSEEIPRVKIVRKREEANDLYFGPYADVKTLRQALKEALTIFPIARCKKQIKLGNSDRSCLFYQLDRCLAPCVNKIDLDTYNKTVLQFIKLFEGKQQDLIREIRADMEKAASDLEFEKAVRLRDKLVVLEKIVQKQTIVSKDPSAEIDIIGLEKEEYLVLLQLLIMRQGRIVEQKHFLMELPYDLKDTELLTIFIQQYYSKTTFIPKRILTREKIKNEKTIDEWLRGKKKLEHKTDGILQQPKTDEGRDLMALAYTNAKSNMTMKIKMNGIKEQRIRKSLQELKDILGLQETPKRIEGYDISTLQGSNTVGSCVVFEMGVPKKIDYRKFIIKTVQEQDDFASMKEVIRRRFSGTLSKTEKKPDLILIDGGKGQVSSVLAELNEMKIDLPLIGLAKEFEEIHFPDRRKPIILDERSEALKLLQRIRDEAHRFAVTFHKQRRSKTMIKSSLEKIPGLGEKKITKLLEHFHNYENIRKATIDDLVKVSGINQLLAEKISKYYEQKTDIN